jgi:serine/threonine protein kinase
MVVIEYISGGSLQSLIDEFRGVPVASARRYLRDILKGLEYLHSEDIVHRDIKPQNVLLLIDGSCKLTDFGTSEKVAKLSGVASMEGTPQYMAPEATLGNAVKASDIWSFGIMMWQLLTGDLPWPREDSFIAMRFMYRLGHDEEMLPVFNDPSVPQDAKDIVQRCCQREASRRPTSTELLGLPFFQVVGATPKQLSRKREVTSQSKDGVLLTPSKISAQLFASPLKAPSAVTECAAFPSPDPTV